MAGTSRDARGAVVHFTASLQKKHPPGNRRPQPGGHPFVEPCGAARPCEHAHGGREESLPCRASLGRRTPHAFRSTRLGFKAGTIARIGLRPWVCSQSLAAPTATNRWPSRAALGPCVGATDPQPMRPAEQTIDRRSCLAAINGPCWIRTSDRVHYEWSALTAELRARQRQDSAHKRRTRTSRERRSCVCQLVCVGSWRQRGNAMLTLDRSQSAASLSGVWSWEERVSISFRRYSFSRRVASRSNTKYFTLRRR